MRRLPLSARVVQRIATRLGNGRTPAGSTNWPLLAFGATAVGTFLILLGHPLGAARGRVFLALLAAGVWSAMTATVPRKLLESSWGGPAVRLSVWWVSGCAVTWSLLDPWSRGPAFILWFGLAGLFAFLCHGRFVLLVRRDREP